MSSYLNTANRVIDEEAQALALLRDSLDQSFDEAVDIIANATGRVIITGMGKSGHIARKIAATLASTGTPAHFVHPAEASHGDLGMIGEGDVCVVLSNSGETPELADLIAYTRRFNIPMIGIASKPESNLIRASDKGLILPNAPEACGHGIVPTCSTTMTLALGDAIAIALMEARAFTKDNFRSLHPGGKLGARLTKVRDLMNSDLPLVRVDTSMGDVIDVISAHGYGVAGVTDANGALIGIITDGDVRRNLADILTKSASDVMTKGPLTIEEDMLAEEAVALMDQHKITCLFVRAGEDGATGILKIQDCLRAGVV